MAGLYKMEIKRVDSMEFDTPVVLTDADRKGAPLCVLEVYREMAWKNYRRAEYEAATRNFNIAMAVTDKDRRTIIGRGFSRSKNTLFEGALADAEAVLAKEPLDKEAICLQAICQYELGNFEEGLAAFHNGMNKRGKRPMFVDGRYQAEGTIEDCVGRYAGPMMTSMKYSVKDMVAWQTRQDLKAARADKCKDDLDIPPPHPCSDSEWNSYQRKLEQIDNIMGGAYLGQLNKDRKWLKQTLQNPNLVSANKKGSAKVVGLTKYILTDVQNRQEMLRSRKPYYHLQYLVSMCDEAMARARVKSDKEKRVMYTQLVSARLNALERSRKAKETRRCVEIGDRIKLMFDKVPAKYIKNKNQMKMDFLTTMSMVYLDLIKFKTFLNLRENYKRANYLLGFDGPYRDLKQDPVVQETMFPFFNYNHWKEKYETYLKFTDDHVERAWLYHEIGRCYGEIQKHEHMGLLGFKCYLEAKNIAHKQWMINGLYMSMIGLMNFHQKDDAEVRFHECLQVALKYKDEDVIEHLLVCGRVLLEKDVQDVLEDANTTIRKKEEYILNLIDDITIQTKAKNLFQRMRVLAPRRFMSVAPGFTPFVTKFTNLKAFSIIPGGSGGRLGIHPVGQETLDDYLDITEADLVSFFLRS